MNPSEPIMTPSQGIPYPLGCSVTEGKANFALFYPAAKELTLCLFSTDRQPYQEIPFDPIKNRTGHIWHLALKNLPLPLLYGYKTPNLPFVLSDPYAKELGSHHMWKGKPKTWLGMISAEEPFDWEDDTPLNIPKNELIIYEMHVRGFTIDPSSKVKHPGTFLGLIEKIPYLKDLGVNAVELLPVHEFNENGWHLRNPSTGESLCNFWGYSTINYFSPMKRYATVDKPGTSLREFKQLVKALHQNGMAIILDVVFNHTEEGNEKGITISFKGLANDIYYIYNFQHGYSNYSGCGNTLNCNHPVVIEMILSSLRYWVVEMHVDGFRFDLAAIFSRGLKGRVLNLSPVLEIISLDPILAKTILIAEPWDAAGLYQLGHFSSLNSCWSEWNDRYRDNIRCFIKGTPGVKAEFATRISGSQDLFGHGAPSNSLNFIISHDGFTLADLVSYNHKHNEANGEKNADGAGFNESWNCGTEGPTKDPKIIALRKRQMRNLHLALMLSQGIPMLHMGDEYGHSKKGNNNTWCQDNPLSWFLWDQLDEKKDFFRFYKMAIAFRKSQPSLRHPTFLSSLDVDWHGSEVAHPQWENQDCFLAFTLNDRDNQSAIFAAFNAHDYSRDVMLPKVSYHTTWLWVVDTAKPSPEDFHEHPHLFPVKKDRLSMIAYSAILLISGGADT